MVVRVAPTQDLGKMLQGLHEIPIEGEPDVIRAIQTAQVLHHVFLLLYFNLLFQFTILIYYLYINL